MKSVSLTVFAGLAAFIAVPASADSSTPRLHPVEAACVEYEMTGQMMNGTTTRCHRDYAYESYELLNTNIGFAGITQSQDQHNITIGEWIYAIDLATNTGTKTANPMYDGIVGALQGSSPEEMSDAFMSGMGFTATTQTKTIADTQCTVYNSAQMGTACMTSDGLMLEQNIMGNITRAVSVSIGSGGDDANYTLYQNVPITDGPDLSNGIQGLMNQLGQQ